jgi:hypothetical protein
VIAGGLVVEYNYLCTSGDENGNPGPVRLAGTPTTNVSNVLSGPFNNVGVQVTITQDTGSCLG